MLFSQTPSLPPPINPHRVRAGPLPGPSFQEEVLETFALVRSATDGLGEKMGNMEELCCRNGDFNMALTIESLEWCEWEDHGIYLSLEDFSNNNGDMIQKQKWPITT